MRIRRKMERMEGTEGPGVVINGERFPFTDEIAFLMADDIARGGADDLPPGGVDRRPAVDRVAEAKRFEAITVVYDHLGAMMGPEERVSWLAAPNAVLDGGRPLDLLAQGCFEDVMSAITTLEAENLS